MNDLISRQDVVKALVFAEETGNMKCGKLREVLEVLNRVQPAQQWIPFSTRHCTEQEKEEHPDWSFYIDCQLPDDGEEILISAKNGNVCEDTIFCDDDCWYLDSGYEIGEDAVAWMPKPKPYAPTQSSDSKALDALGKGNKR